MSVQEVKDIRVSISERLKKALYNTTLLKKLAYNLLVEEDLNLSNEDEKRVFEERKKACGPCPNNASNLYCKSCGCLLSVKQAAKTNFSIKKMSFEITHCPEGRWGDLALSNYYRNL